MATHWTTKELLEAGLNQHKIDRQLREGTLYRLSRGLYTREKPDPQAALRALQHRYPKLIFTGVTAAGVYGLLPEISAPAQGSLPYRHRPIHNDALHAVPSRRRRYRRVNGIDVTTPIAAVAGIYPTDGFWDLVKFLEKSYDGLRGRERFTREIRQLTPADRAKLAPLLKHTVIGASSRMARMLIADLTKRGMDPIPNFKLGPYTWDIGFDPGTTTVDLDSRRYHQPDATSPANDRGFIIDRWKTNYAIQRGWAALRYTDDCIREIRKDVLDQIQHTVNHRKNPTVSDAAPPQ